MKKFIPAITILLTIYSTFSVAQSCLPGGKIFESQEQIDNFQYDYPGCTEILGYVRIDGDSINNLMGLSPVVSIGGNFTIHYCDSLNNLNGLENLTMIGGELAINYNYSLTNLIGLNNLTSIDGSLSIGSNNPSMTSLEGIGNLESIGGNLEIRQNQFLTSLEGLNNLDTIPGDLFIFWGHSLTDLSGLEGVTFIGGDMKIYFPSLTSFEGLENFTTVNGRILIETCYNLTDLTSLYNLNSIGGEIIISNNDTLTSLAGLDNIDPVSITSLIIENNDALTECEVQSICNYLSDPEAIATIDNNFSGCNSREQIEEACLVSVNELHLSNRLKIHPNPFTTSTTLSYSLKQPSTVHLSVFNQLGKLIYEYSEKQQPGMQKLQWNAKDQPEGLYYYRLQAGNQTANGKLIKVK